MAVVSPLSAVRFIPAQQTDLVAPPYDVLTAEDKHRLLTRNKHNIVAIDLPHVPPKEAGPDEAYAAAGRTLRMWLEHGGLRRDPTPGFYAYQQTYTHAGAAYTRRGLFARVRLEAFSPESSIHPHEQTFSGPKEDRLKLMRATRANLSPVFGLYDDPQNDITDILFDAVRGMPPIAVADLPAQDGKSTVTSQLWGVNRRDVVQTVQEMLSEKHIYIADGHHRYGTCLTYRAELSQRQGVPMTGDHAADYALFVLVAMQDPGLIILPTHRVVGNMEGYYLDKFLAAAAPYFTAAQTTFGGDQLHRLEQELPGYGAHAMGVYDPVEDVARVLQPHGDDPLQQFSEAPELAGKSAAWRQLDVAILQHLLFDRVISPAFTTAGKPLTWAFPHEAPEVAALCRAGTYRAGFILQPTPLTAVRDLCNANELMPQKSTFFYPKLATGLVINPLD